MLESSPDLPEQLAVLEDKYLKNDVIIDGVFLIQVHIGYYTGLTYFGGEAMEPEDINVFAMLK